MKKITLSDIAEKAGYSVNTVSHALHNKNDISEKTKQYICQIADELGYIRNDSASALRSGKSRCVAIIAGDSADPRLAVMIRIMERHLHEYGYTALLINSGEDEAAEKAAVISAIRKNVDGILLCPVQKSMANIRLLESKKVAYVLFGRRFPSADANYVVCDEEQGGYEAAEHLIGLGHRRILQIDCSCASIRASERHDGICRALRQHGLPEQALEMEMISAAIGIGCLETILAGHGVCTAVICGTDLLAQQVCYCLKKQGKTVPENVSVMGFDDCASVFYSSLMLTSVTASKNKMAVEAVDTLMDSISGNPRTMQCVLPTRLIVRDSTGKAPE